MQLGPYSALGLVEQMPHRSQVGVFRVGHWFDGYGQVHRFQVVAPDSTHQKTRVIFNSRMIEDARYTYARKYGHLPPLPNFAERVDPCEAIFRKAQTEFNPADPTLHCVLVTLSSDMPGVAEVGKQAVPQADARQGRKCMVVKTEAKFYKILDPETLKPHAMTTQTDIDPRLTGTYSASHHRTDPLTGDVFNYNLDVDNGQSQYRIFTIRKATGETSILAQFKASPAYIHSLFLTTDYVILCVWNFHFTPTETPGFNIFGTVDEFNPDIPSKWYVVDRTGKLGVVAIFDGPAFFSFHTINAWQEKNLDNETVDIVAELLIYENHDFVHKLFYKHLLSDSEDARLFIDEKADSIRSSLARFRLPAIDATADGPVRKATIDWNVRKDLSPELPTYNGLRGMKPTRYTYFLTNRDKSTLWDAICKFDNRTHEVLLWEEQGHTPGEAIFVPDPQGHAEDDGVLLSVILNGHTGKSYLLCLDARSLRVLGKAHVDGAVSFNFHGQHVTTEGGVTGDF